MTTPIITSLLDTDLYKFTMMQAVLHQFPAAEVAYQFRCRSENVDFRACQRTLQPQLEALCGLRFTEEELVYLQSLNYIKPDFVEFLRLFKLSPRFVQLSLKGPELTLTVQGPWLHCILFEVPLLAIISETYARQAHPAPDLDFGRQRLQDKIRRIRAYPQHASFSLCDFGTRRRYSRAWQQEVVETLQHALPGQLAGTSNTDLARRLGLRALGTMAHEFLQGCQALGPRLVDSQKFALECWTHEYRGQLGIALTDVIGIDPFLRDFDLYFAKLFDGLRHDSGDPFAWTDKVLDHYRTLGIDASQKTLVFSDALTIERALEIHRHVRQRARVMFGIGTHLTNDTGFTPPDIVIKMTRCNGQPVAKISDSRGKVICQDNGYLRYLAQVFQVDLSDRL